MSGTCPAGQEIDFITQGCAPSSSAAGKAPGVYETHLPIGAPGGSCAWRCNWVWSGNEAADKAIASQAADCVGKNDKSGGWVLPTIRNYYQGKKAGAGEGAEGQEVCPLAPAKPGPSTVGVTPVEVYQDPVTKNLRLIGAGLSIGAQWAPFYAKKYWWVLAAAGVVISGLWFLSRSRQQQEWDY